MSYCGKQAVPTLTEMLSSDEPEVQLAAIEALELLGADAKAAVPKMAEMSREGTPDVRWASKRALGSIMASQEQKR